MRLNRIAEERKRSGMTVADLAEKIGASVGEVRDWEDGRKDIPASKIVALAGVFGASTDYLLGR